MGIKNEDTDTLDKIKDELTIYNNFLAITDKLDGDGYLKTLVGNLDDIFKNEVLFALNGKVIRDIEAAI